MKLAILQCDSVRTQFRGQFSNYPAMIETIFRRIDPSIKFDVFDVQDEQYPTVLDAYDAYVTTGSKASVYDDEKWITTLEQFLIKLNEKNHTLIAICFGHQLVAQAFGGKTEKSDKGWGVGVHCCDIKSKKAWMQPEIDRINVIVSHQDQVTLLPPGAELIAGNDFCPYSMFQLGSNILTIQGHPEFNKPYSETLMHFREKIIGTDTLQKGLLSLKLQTHEDVLTRWFIHFIKANQQ